MSEAAQEAKGEEVPETPPVEVSTEEPQAEVTVEVGQIWKDNDPRSGERYVEVKEIGDRATVQQVLVGTGGPQYIGRITYIRLDRFGTGTGTSYTLIGDYAALEEVYVDDDE